MAGTEMILQGCKNSSNWPGTICFRQTFQVNWLCQRWAPSSKVGLVKCEQKGQEDKERRRAAARREEGKKSKTREKKATRREDRLLQTAMVAGTSVSLNNLHGVVIACCCALHTRHFV